MKIRGITLKIIVFLGKEKNQFRQEFYNRYEIKGTMGSITKGCWMKKKIEYLVGSEEITEVSKFLVYVVLIFLPWSICS